MRVCVCTRTVQMKSSMCKSSGVFFHKMCQWLNKVFIQKMMSIFGIVNRKMQSLSASIDCHFTENTKAFTSNVQFGQEPKRLVVFKLKTRKTNMQFSVNILNVQQLLFSYISSKCYDVRSNSKLQSSKTISIM